MAFTLPRLQEPDVALTDYLLTLECAALLAKLDRSESITPAFGAFLITLGLASLTGGTFHGFIREYEGWRCRLLWRSTLILLGLNTLAMWRMAADITKCIASQKNHPLLRRWVWASGLAYFTTVLLTPRGYTIVMVFQAPAFAAMCVAFWRRWRVLGDHCAVYGLLGQGSAVLATAAGIAKVSAPRVGLTRWGVYHLIAGAAVWLLFKSTKKATQTQPLPN